MDFQGIKELAQSGDLSETAKQVFRTGQVLNLMKEQLAADSIIAATGLKSFCGLPLVSRGRVLGVLGVGSSREATFTEDDVSFLSQVANQIAIAVEKAMVEERKFRSDLYYRLNVFPIRVPSLRERREDIP
jgi:transcriptional regulator with GAF, ATPase, and Fis domain